MQITQIQELGVNIVTGFRMGAAVQNGCSGGMWLDSSETQPAWCLPVLPTPRAPRPPPPAQATTKSNRHWPNLHTALTQL